jgi:uncharacterized hydantoinase/oxoprolinase family protein
MIAADRTLFSAADARAAAVEIAAAQVERITAAVRRVLSRLAQPPQVWLVSGQGEFLARDVIAHVVPHAAIVSLAQQLGPRVSHVAPAHALAVLAAESES